MRKGNGEKMKIYKDVPEQFHNQFMETIDMLAEEKEQKIVKLKAKRMMPLVAAVVLALSTLTVSAACIFAWHQAAKDRLGVSEELAEQMSEKGMAKEETASFSAEGVDITAIQSVMTDNYCYVLLSVSVPKQLVIDEDMLFGESRVESDAEFTGCVINHVPESDDGSNSLWEVQLLTSDTENYAGVEATIILNDLIQTEKAEVTETLIKGEWKIPITLPLEPDVLAVKEECVMRIGHHEVTIKHMEVTPFEIRLYGNKEELQHAIHYQNTNAEGVYYQDGTFVEENSVINVTKGHNDDKTGENYILIELPTAIDIMQYAQLVLEEKEDTAVAMALSEDELAQMTVLYERYGHKLLYREGTVLLWDENCKVGTEIVNLTNLGYDEGKGDSFEVGPGGKLLHVMTGNEKKVFDVMY